MTCGRKDSPLCVCVGVPLLVHFGVVRLLPGEAEHATDHSGILGCPVLVADLLPGLSVLHLYIALCHRHAPAVGRQDGSDPDVLHLDVQVLEGTRHRSRGVTCLVWPRRGGGQQGPLASGPAGRWGWGRAGGVAGRAQEQSEKRAPAPQRLLLQPPKSPDSTAQQPPSVGSQNKCGTENMFSLNSQVLY